MKTKVGFWELIAGIVLRNRIAIISLIVLFTVFLAFQWKHIHFTYTEANLLPDDHEVNLEYNSFLKEFGEEGNIIVIGSKDPKLFTPKIFKEWQVLMTKLQKQPEVDFLISVDNIKKLQKNDSLNSFQLVPFIDKKQTTDVNYLNKIKEELYNKTPFYEGLLFNKKNQTLRAVVYLDKKIINTPKRKDFVLNSFIPKIFDFEITILTGLIPSLVIVIGIPNCIFLTNKYQQEYSTHGNKAKALQRVITRVGMATLMTNLTTAAGFATFMITNSELLKEFGLVAAVSIVALFFLCLIIIPIYYSYQPIPKEKHLQHLNRNYTKVFMQWIEKMVKYNRRYVYAIAIILFIISVFGAFNIKTSGSLTEDMPKNEAFFKDIIFFEKEFDGVMPLEITINTKRKNGVMRLTTMKRMDELQKSIEAFPELSKPLSIVNLVKYSKQAFYNGNPDFYELPTSQEQAFILSYAKNSAKNSQKDFIKSYVSKDGSVARITTFMKDIGPGNMEKVENKLVLKINEIFPSDRYEVTLTGKAYVFQKGTKYLLDNLISSLLFAIFLISMLMVFMFRSFKMVVISLIPNLLPLIITAGLMGYFGIPLKPSTILIFSIAFGLSVDDTIHFLAQYRQELTQHNWKIKKSVFATLKEAGVSMFYTSVVLFSGFSVFMLSSFGGTVALGGLIAFTLFFGMLSNLLLLPCLVLTLNKSLANQQEFIEPKIDILERKTED